MKCTNEACPYRQEPGPIECPAANNGCGGYISPNASIHISNNGGQTNESLHTSHTDT